MSDFPCPQLTVSKRTYLQHLLLSVKTLNWLPYSLDMSGDSCYITTRLRGVLNPFCSPASAKIHHKSRRFFQDGSGILRSPDRVVVRRIEEKESIKGAFIIPDSAKETAAGGEVIAVGAGRARKGRAVPLDV